MSTTVPEVVAKSRRPSARMSPTVPEVVTKSRRPSDSAFKQQRLPAWQPILTAGTVLPSFFIIGILFIPVGIVLLLISTHVKEMTFDYTNCKNALGVVCADSDRYSFNACTCTIPFTLREPMNDEVYLYYGLTNFYQNHRRYVKSRDTDQFRGLLSPEPSSNCEPFAYSDDKKPIVPCGAIANSLFNDSITLHYGLEKVPLLRTGIAWESDKKIKFKNPPGDLQQALAGYAKPKNWRKNLWELDPENPDNNGLQNEDLMVWMRTAALPTFRKLYRRVDHEKEPFKIGLPKGNYTFQIDYYYHVKEFEGKKKVILSTTSVLGGKNPFLGVAYIVVGVISFFLGVTFLIIHLKFGRSTAEIININHRLPE